MAKVTDFPSKQCGRKRVEGSIKKPVSKAKGTLWGLVKNPIA
jgi:hypothetical protein